MAEHLKKIYAGPIVFVMVGDGPLRGQIEEELQRRRLSEIFCLTGWRSDLTTVYSGFDVLVNTSDNEGTPVAVLEALSSGLPVVATDVGGTAEILNYPNEPVMCFALDEEAKACEVLADWLREGRRISVETRRAVVEEFSQQKLLERLLKIYGADG